MTDINKLIEEEAIQLGSDSIIQKVYDNIRLFLDKTGKDDELQKNDCYYEGILLLKEALIELNFYKKRSRWRKLSDLLELKEFGFHILTRVPDEKKMFYHTTMYLGNEEDLDVIKYMLELELGKDPSYGDLLEWKPIF